MRLQIHKIQNILCKTNIEIVNNAIDADVCVAGVCSAFYADEKRSLDLVDFLKSLDKEVYAYGCMCAVNPDKLSSDRNYKTWEADKLLYDISGNKTEFFFNSILPDFFSRKEEYRVYDPGKKFLCITFGCSFDCSYCPHKLGIGKPYSINEQEIIYKIVEYNSDPLIHTIYLTGTDTACYGFEVGSTFAKLLDAILVFIRKDIKIVVSQFNPEGIFRDYDLTFKSFGNKQIIELQMPVQTGSQRLLKLMNRNYNLQVVGEFLQKLKKVNSKIYLRTDVLAGFPTENWDDIAATIAFVKNNFSEVAVYEFEMREGTKISTMGLDCIDPEMRKERYKYYIESFKQNGMNVHSGGQAIETLIENDCIKERRMESENT